MVQVLPPNLDWDYSTHVLSTKSFPATSVLRIGGRGKHGGRHTCSCSSQEEHVDLFRFLKRVLVPTFTSGYDFTPSIKVCWNAENLWECQLPRSLTGLGKRVSFYELPTLWHAQKVLMEGTYWFPRLMGKKTDAGNSIHGKALLRLIGGYGSYTGPEEVYQMMHRKISREGVNKLRNILATVDGLVMQIVLSFFETDFLSWQRIDQVIYCMITQLLPDYFRQDTVGVNRLSTFEKVKKLRKAVKMAGFNPQQSVADVNVPRELSFFRTICNMLGSSKSPLSMDRVMTLCQTRASGVPPRSVFLKTQRKLREVLTTPPDPTRWKAVGFYVGRGIDQLHYDILHGMSETKRERFLSRCLASAKISLSDSGEFFTKTAEGGKLEATRKVLSSIQEVDEIDLNTGFKTGRVLNQENSTVGDMIFNWACGHFTDRAHIYETNVMSVRVSLVSELGKYRGITVSHLAHSVLLHVASHVLLEYIKEVPSSRSGVSAANHAWNFFKLLSHKNPAAEWIFGDKDCYVFSTDWEDATNYCDHTVAQGLINRLMAKLGFPTWYRQTVTFALCAPRQVEFIDDETNVLERYFTTRGVLMGDPVTKVVLHLYHIVARYAAEFTLRM
nr:MAG: RNA-dependent RNA polymerase [Narnaviridae sp.]